MVSPREAQLRIVRIEAEHGPVMGRLESDGRVRPFGFTDSTPLIEAAGADGGPDKLPAGHPVAGDHWLAPVSDPRKIVGIGLNYVDHATEATMLLPSEPLVFAKFPSSIIGPGETIRCSWVALKRRGLPGRARGRDPGPCSQRFARTLLSTYSDILPERRVGV